MTTQELLSAAKAGVPVLSRATEAQKNSALRSMANALEARADASLQQTSWIWKLQGATSPR